MAHLSPRQVAELRAALEAERGRLRRLAEPLHEGLRRPQADALGELSLRDNHPADTGSELFERSKDLALLDLLQRRLDQVEKALGRIDQGLYGLCARCGQPIPWERLRAVPEAELCLACQEELERWEHPALEARPIEEEALRGPAARMRGFAPPHRVAWDEEDAWQEVQQYGTSDTPQDMPERMLRGDERVGLVEAIEGLVDHTGEPIGDAPSALRQEAHGAAEGATGTRRRGRRR